MSLERAGRGQDRAARATKIAGIRMARMIPFRFFVSLIAPRSAGGLYSQNALPYPMFLKTQDLHPHHDCCLLPRLYGTERTRLAR